MNSKHKYDTKIIEILAINQIAKTDLFQKRIKILKNGYSKNKEGDHFFMKKIKRAILIFLLLIILAYTTNITAIPNSVIIFQGEELNLGTTFGLYLKEKEDKTVQTSSTIDNKNVLSKKTVTISLFNLFDIKDLEINTIPETTVIPLGNLVGLKLYTSRSTSSWKKRNKWSKTVCKYRNRRRRYNSRNKSKRNNLYI